MGGMAKKKAMKKAVAEGTSSSDAGDPTRYLSRRDAVMKRVIATVGPYTFTPQRQGTHFDALVRAILYQQLSGKAAATIHGRVKALFGGQDPSPEAWLQMSEEAIAGCGVSRQKLSYLRDLAERSTSGALLLQGIDALADDAVVAALTSVKGVGLWTAQMFLLFRLGRPDVLPEGDLGIQTAIERAYGLPSRPGPSEVARIGKKWRPEASCAAWYLWRFLDNRPPQ